LLSSGFKKDYTVRGLGFVFSYAFTPILSGALVISPLVLAHAEHDKARYVAENGKDEGRCDQRRAPCNTIAYAATQAGKGDRILVAEGRYEITDLDSIFYLSSSAVPVSGGYTKNTFQKTSAATGNSILVGVPTEFAQGLTEKGFTVIADTKGLARDQQAYLNAKQSQLTAMAEAQAAVPCAQGKAGEFSCQNLDLLAHVPLATLGNSNSRGNDIWGHTDMNDGREYALMGLTNGISVVEVTDPQNPHLVSFVASQNTIWRDLKTYQYFDENRRRWMSYAYVTADAASVGTLILDLNQLPTQVAVAATELSDTSAHNIYISNVDYSTGIALTNRTPYLHVAGSDKRGGAFNSYSLAAPTQPVSVYKKSLTSRTNYSHDLSSLWVTDARRAQCVDTNNDCDLLLDFNEDEFLLWDKTNSAAPTALSHTQYPLASYVHSGWWTEDKQFIAVHDELDEQRYSLTTRVRFFALDNLRAPELVGEYIGPTAAIDHNGYARGNRYYMSNYERGLVVLDITNPRAPTEAGFFDTYPLANSASFNGAWGVYPFLPSGNILVSDINSGLYVIRDKSASTQGQVKFSTARVQAKEGELLRVSLLREAGSDGNVSVFYETQQGNATADDYTAMAGEVVWLAGDASEKIIDIPIVADGAGNEFTETFFVRLYNPRNGLTLAAPNLLMVDIADKADEPVGASSSSAQSSNASSAVTNSSTANSSAPRKAMTNNSGGGAPTLLFGVGLIFLSLIKRRINVSECNGN
jgi:choice-of-anchor B domain-containing protein